jgi:hypothetical protein
MELGRFNSVRSRVLEQLDSENARENQATRIDECQ